MPQFSIRDAAIGAVVGGTVAYVAMRAAAPRQEPTAFRPTRPTPPIPPPSPLPDGPIVEPPRPEGASPGFGVAYHRDPLPQFKIEIPSGGNIDIVDDAICNVLDDLPGELQQSDLKDLEVLVLHQLMPDVDWPAVPGDHPTIFQLEGMVHFAVQETANRNPNLSVNQNLRAACPAASMEAVEINPEKEHVVNGVSG